MSCRALLQAQHWLCRRWVGEQHAAECRACRAMWLGRCRHCAVRRPASPVRTCRQGRLRGGSPRCAMLRGAAKPRPVHARLTAAGGGAGARSTCWDPCWCRTRCGRRCRRPLLQQWPTLRRCWSPRSCRGWVGGVGRCGQQGPAAAADAAAEARMAGCAHFPHPTCSPRIRSAAWAASHHVTPACAPTLPAPALRSGARPRGHHPAAVHPGRGPAARGRHQEVSWLGLRLCVAYLRCRL